MTIDDLVTKLKGVKKSRGGFLAKCPTHKDKVASLNIDQVGGKVLLYCHAGCSTARIVEKLGVKWQDLFTEKPDPVAGLKGRSFSQDGVSYFASPKSTIAAVYRYSSVRLRCWWDKAGLG